MKRTGIFITKEELDRVKTAYSCSGMFLSGGMPMGDPGYEVKQIMKNYPQVSKTAGLDLKTGEFVEPA